MALNEKQRVLLETNAARDRAEALLRGLLDAKAESEKQMATFKRPDAYKAVTGKSSIDNAIASTRRLIETLNRELDRAQREIQQNNNRLAECAPLSACRSPSTGA
ncbi:MAG: hypothetical protein EA379_08330 [Phycisphaerales bacterium]|nr:MAG: hypothetical protein EA379_08330 [Phycisphaerales bacterium]